MARKAVKGAVTGKVVLARIDVASAGAAMEFLSLHLSTWRLADLQGDLPSLQD